ncbi:MAG: hypothetical protein U0R78_09215 [Nocardioidaceae bacterium]
MNWFIISLIVIAVTGLVVRSQTKPATAAPMGMHRMRRSVIAAVTVTVASLSLAGCDTNSAAGTSQDQITTAYSALAKNSAAFYAAVADNPNPVPTPPTTVEELQRNVDYIFTDGVEIASYTRNDGVCFSGPHDTFLAITGTDTPEDGIKRIFGTGECSRTDGDIVIIDNIDTHDPSSPVVDKFVKGEDLAADVTGLSDFTDYLERAQKLSAPATN